MKEETSEKTWQEAVDHCKRINSILIEPREVQLNTIAKSYKSSWIGASDIDVEGTFVWKSNGESLTYTDWGPVQPNDNEGNQDCAAMQTNDRWGDFDCSTTMAFVCQADKGKTHILSMKYILSQSVS